MTAARGPRVRYHALVLAMLALTLAPAPAGAKVLFTAECASPVGQRVDINDWESGAGETWKRERYVAGAPDGAALRFVSDDEHPSALRVRWGRAEALRPIVFKSADQMSVAAVDDLGVWIYTLYFSRAKVLISRQTSSPETGAVGALLTADCGFDGK